MENLASNLPGWLLPAWLLVSVLALAIFDRLSTSTPTKKHDQRTFVSDGNMSPAYR